MTEREEFEKFLSYKGIASNYCGDGQYTHVFQLAYEAWQACAELKDKRIRELEAKLRQAEEEIDGLIESYFGSGERGEV